MLRTHESRYAEQLNMVYKGNRLTKVSKSGGSDIEYDLQGYPEKFDASTEMTYDSNGNMTADFDRDIVAIRYNLLNLPDTVQFRNGSAIVNYYTADGKRTGSKYLTPLTTVVIPAGQTFGSTSGTVAMSSHVTARRGSLEYAGADFESDTLIRIHNGDGYLDCSEQDFRYFVRDYQGNIRTVYGSAVAKLIPVEPPFSLTNRGAIGGDKPPIRPKPIEHTVTYQRMQYYPFGLPYEAHYQPEEQPYKYGGKEFIEQHGYDSYDFDARMYYPALCRFMTMDPLCEKYYSISPYAYCNDNPVNYVDPDGRKVEADKLSQKNISNTLTKQEVKFIRFDKSGVLDIRRLNKSKSFSENMTALKALANSEVVYSFQVKDKDHAGFAYYDNSSTGGNFYRGTTEMPNAESNPSPDNKVYVLVGKNLNEKQQVMTTAHEAFGHAYFYEVYRNVVKASHTYKPEVRVIWDEELHMNIFEITKVPTNLILENQIKTVVKQAENNYEEKKNP